MRYSELAGKEIIDVGEGTRLGVVNTSDLYLDAETGRVEAIIMPQRAGWFSNREIVIPWHGVRKVGADFIIVDTSTIGEAASFAAQQETTTALPAPVQLPIRRVSGFPVATGVAPGWRKRNHIHSV